MSFCGTGLQGHQQEQKAAVEMPVCFALRADRVTASIVDAACHTLLLSPLLRLVKHVHYPEGSLFSSPAIEWCRSKENVAGEAYIAKPPKCTLTSGAKTLGCIFLPTTLFWQQARTNWYHVAVPMM